MLPCSFFSPPPLFQVLQPQRDFSWTPTRQVSGKQITSPLLRSPFPSSTARERSIDNSSPPLSPAYDPLGSIFLYPAAPRAGLPSPFFFFRLHRPSLFLWSAPRSIFWCPEEYQVLFSFSFLPFGNRIRLPDDVSLASFFRFLRFADTIHFFARHGNPPTFPFFPPRSKEIFFPFASLRRPVIQFHASLPPPERACFP